MEFLLLGPVEARAGDRPVNLGRRRERLLMGVLLLNASKPMSIDRLIQLLWEDDPTPAARASLHSHVARLRSVLDGHRVRITTRGAAYVAEVDPASVDAHRFRRDVERSRQLTDPRHRADLLRHALELWRGPLLADVADEPLRGRIGAELAELRLAAIESRAEAELTGDRHRQVAFELTAVVDAHPTREHLAELLMLALYRDGRQGDALAVYRRVRTTLNDELGLSPGPALASLHMRILRGDPSLDLPPPEPPAVHRRQFLPRRVPDFTGRVAEIERLDQLAQADLSAPAIVLTAIAGAGKTALAVHWGHRVAARFPDGQLYVDLRGYDARRPADPIEALAVLLRALGLAPERVPTDQDEAAALLRSLLAEQRVLILLDNARSASQVRPLLPAGPSSLVMVTSRDALHGLVARDGARRLELHVLTPAESIALLTRIVGEQRASADPDAVADLAACCGHLPIALRIAAASLVHRPSTTVRRLVQELRKRGRLAALEIPEDAESSVRTTFDHSLAALPVALHRVFTLLGLTAGVHLTVESFAALCGTTVERAAVDVYRLVEAHLVEEIAPGRYAIHDLIREYARDRLTRENGADTQRDAVDRLTGWYLGASDAAAELLYPQMVRLPLDDVGLRRPTFETHATALAWFDAEWPNVVTWLHDLAARADHHAWLLADCLRGYFWLARLNPEWLDVADTALRLAQSVGERRAEAAARLSLGNVHLNLNRHSEAVEHYRAAVEASVAADWSAGEASALNNLATLHWLRCELDAAEACLRQAMNLNQRIGRRLGEARNLSQLGQLAAERGRLTEAISLTERALAIETELNSVSGQVKDMLALGNVRRLCGDPVSAEALLLDALARARMIGETRGEAEVLTALATVAADLGRNAEARHHAEAALALASEIGDPHGEAPSRTVLARIERQSGRLDDAERECLCALKLADDASDHYLRATTLVELGRIWLELDLVDRAYAAAVESGDIARRAGYRLIEADADEVVDHARRATAEISSHRRTVTR